MEEWFEIPGVAVLDEHQNPSAKDEFRNVDRDLLATIAANSQRRIDDTGDECPVVVDFESRRGHTPRPNENRPMPQVAGYARNFRVVDRFGKVNPRSAIVCDMRFKKSDRERLQQFPRRSIEIWPQDKIIDPIALLGAETPKRDLGLMRFSRGESERLIYQMDEPLNQEPDGDENKQAIIEACMQAFANSPMGQFIANLMQQQAPTPPAPAPVAPAPPPVPAAEPPKEPEEEPKKMSRTRADVERDDLKLRMSRLESELSEAKKEAEDAKRGFRRADRERVLTQLQAEGYKFSRAEELDDVQDMDDKAFEKHVGRIKQNYAKAPVSALPRSYGRSGSEIADGGDSRMTSEPVQFSREDLDKTYELMRSQKVTFEAAREQVLAAKKG